MKKSQYLELSTQWRRKWTGVFSVGVPGPDENPELLWDCVVTCDTESCDNYGMYWWEQVQENLDGMYRVVCGLCGQVVTDIDPMLEDDEEFRFNCRRSDGTMWAEEQKDDRP